MTGSEALEDVAWQCPECGGIGGDYHAVGGSPFYRCHRCKAVFAGDGGKVPQTREAKKAMLDDLRALEAELRE